MCRNCYWCADGDDSGNGNNIAVVQSNAPFGYHAADGGWIISSVDSVRWFVKSHPDCPVGATGVWHYINDPKVSGRGRRAFFSDTYRTSHHYTAVMR